MKRFAVFLLSVFLLAENIFAQELYQIIDVTPENIYEQFDSLEKGENYSINFAENFDFSLLDEEFFKYRMVQKLHELYESGSSLKFTGPFDYIYYNGMQTVNNFSVIKTTITEAPEKKFCVDISDSTYNQQENNALHRLPDNCFAGHENLYWVYFGNFCTENVSAGVCSNLPNLQAVFFWNELDIEPSAFMNVNSKALYVSNDLEIVCPLKEYVSGEVFGRVKDKYNYAKFTSAYDYDPYSGVKWLVEGEEDCYYGWWEEETPQMPKKQTVPKTSVTAENEDYLEFPLIEYEDEEDDYDYESDEYDYESDEYGEDYDEAAAYDLLKESVQEFIDELEWTDFWDSYLEITKNNAKAMVVKNPETSDQVAANFMISLFLGNSDYKKYIYEENHYEPFQQNASGEEFTFQDYGNVSKLILAEQGSEDGYVVYWAGVEYEKDGKIVKDMTIFPIHQTENGWKVQGVQHETLLDYLLLSIIFGSY